MVLFGSLVDLSMNLIKSLQLTALTLHNNNKGAVYLSIFLFYLSIFLSIDLSFYLSIYLSIYVFIS